MVTRLKLPQVHAIPAVLVGDGMIDQGFSAKKEYLLAYLLGVRFGNPPARKDPRGRRAGILGS
jgi:hypothetical protein